MNRVYFSEQKFCAMDLQLREIISATVGALGYDSIKPEQELALLSFLQGHDVFIASDRLQKERLLRCLAWCKLINQRAQKQSGLG